jgi:hypothetical protein
MKLPWLTAAGPSRMVAPLVALALCATQLTFIFPGELISDSRDQLQQAITHHYWDWHPPIMAYVWSWLLRINGNPGLLLVAASMFALAGFRVDCGWLLSRAHAWQGMADSCRWGFPGISVLRQGDCKGCRNGLRIGGRLWNAVLVSGSAQIHPVVDGFVVRHMHILCGTDPDQRGIRHRPDPAAVLRAWASIRSGQDRRMFGAHGRAGATAFELDQPWRDRGQVSGSSAITADI